MSELNGMWRAATKIIDEKNAEIERLRGLLRVLVDGLNAHDDGTYSGELRTAICHASGTAPDQPDVARAHPIAKDGISPDWLERSTDQQATPQPDATPCIHCGGTGVIRMEGVGYPCPNRCTADQQDVYYCTPEGIKRASDQQSPCRIWSRCTLPDGHGSACEAADKPSAQGQD
jgi:hypothetical protein